MCHSYSGYHNTLRQRVRMCSSCLGLFFSHFALDNVRAQPFKQIGMGNVSSRIFWER